MHQSLISGDTLSLLTPAGSYPASAGWVLHHRLVPRTAGGPAITLDATAEGDDHRTLVAASTTAGWAAGSYSWSSWVTRGAESYTVSSGQTVIQPDPRAVTAGYDGRSQSRKALDDARAAFAAWTPTRQSYTIGTRQMHFNSPADIIKTITYWEQQVAAEERQAGRAAPTPRRIYSRI